MAASRPTTPAGAATPNRVREHDDASCESAGDQPPEPGPDRRSEGVVVSIDDAAGALGDAALTWLRDALARAVREALALEGVGGADHEVRVRIVGDAEMSTLHGAHMHDPATTDVLTFDLRDDADGPLDVDIVVCADEASREGAARDRGPERELLLYALHGVLHCLGHDDGEEAAFAQMHAREDEVLSRIGVGSLFSSGAGEASS